MLIQGDLKITALTLFDSEAFFTASTAFFWSNGSTSMIGFTPIASRIFGMLIFSTISHIIVTPAFTTPVIPLAKKVESPIKLKQ